MILRHLSFCRHFVYLFILLRFWKCFKVLHENEMKNIKSLTFMIKKKKKLVIMFSFSRSRDCQHFIQISLCENAFPSFIRNVNMRIDRTLLQIEWFSSHSSVHCRSHRPEWTTNEWLIKKNFLLWNFICERIMQKDIFLFFFCFSIN